MKQALPCCLIQLYIPRATTRSTTDPVTVARTAESSSMANRCLFINCIPVLLSKSPLRKKINVNLSATTETPFNMPPPFIVPGPEGCQAIPGTKAIRHPYRTSAGTISLLHTGHLSCLFSLRQCLYLCTYKTKKFTGSYFKPDEIAQRWFGQFIIR